MIEAKDGGFVVKCNMCTSSFKVGHYGAIVGGIVSNGWYLITASPKGEQNMHVCNHCSRIKSLSEMKS